jgi:hypothetical protein
MSLVGLLALALCTVNSCVYVSGCGDWNARAKYERQVELSAPLAPGSSFSAETRDGSITLEGAQTAECRLVATIRTRAATEDEAMELAEQIQVKLEPRGETLVAVIEKPSTIRNARYGVSLQGTIPTQTNLALVTSDGSIHVANIDGNIDARTSDGSIKASGIRGDTKLKTSDGRIICERVEGAVLDVHTSDGSINLGQIKAESCAARTSDGSITLTEVRTDNLDLHTTDGAIRCHGISAANLSGRTSDGSVQIEYASDAPNVIDATVSTSDGSITFVAPPGLSATVDASTNDGSVRTALPITVEGKVGKSLRGTIGAGEGRLVLRTHDGSITIQ